MSDGDMVHGVVASVDAIPLGSELAVAANIGDTLLTVADVSDFWAGTRLNLNGVIYPYTTIDDTAQTVLLSTPLTAAAAVSDAVQVWDPASNLVAVMVEAAVIAQGDSSTGDPIMAIVDPGVIPYLPLGPRDPANAGDAESVILTERNGLWWLTAIGGRSSSFSDVEIIGGTITGALIRTAPSGERVEMSTAPPYAYVYFFTGDPHESAGGYISASGSSPYGLNLSFSSPSRAPFTGVSFPRSSYLTLTSQDVSQPSAAQLNAAEIILTGATLFDGFGSSAGTAINGMDIGSSVTGNASTNSSGQNTYNHNLGTTPKLVLIQAQSTYLIPAWVAASLTTFTVQWTNPTTGAVAVGYNPTIGFLAIA